MQNRAIQVKNWTEASSRIRGGISLRALRISFNPPSPLSTALRCSSVGGCSLVVKIVQSTAKMKTVAPTLKAQWTVSGIGWPGPVERLTPISYNIPGSLAAITEITGLKDLEIIETFIAIHC